MNSLYDGVKVLSLLPDEDIGTTAEQSVYVDMRDVNKALFIVEIEDALNDVFDTVKLVQATDSSGTGKKDVANAAITDFTNFTADGDKLMLELDSIAVDFNNSFFFVAVELKTTGAGGADTVTVMAVVAPKYLNDEINTAKPATNIKKVPAG